MPPAERHYHKPHTDAAAFLGIAKLGCQGAAQDEWAPAPCADICHRDFHGSCYCIQYPRHLQQLPGATQDPVDQYQQFQQRAGHPHPANRDLHQFPTVTRSLLRSKKPAPALRTLSALPSGPPFLLRKR